MVRMRTMLAAAVLTAGGWCATAGAQPALQPDDRGGPGYTTGTTMGRDGAQSGASSDPDVATSGRVRRKADATAPAHRRHRSNATAGTPGLHGRGTETTEGGAGTTGGAGPGRAPTGH
jgi:hypothetical protein